MWSQRTGHLEMRGLGLVLPEQCPLQVTPYPLQAGAEFLPERRPCTTTPYLLQEGAKVLEEVLPVDVGRQVEPQLPQQVVVLAVRQLGAEPLEDVPELHGFHKPCVLCIQRSKGLDNRQVMTRQQVLPGPCTWRIFHTPYFCSHETHVGMAASLTKATVTEGPTQLAPGRVREPGHLAVARPQAAVLP